MRRISFFLLLIALILVFPFVNTIAEKGSLGTPTGVLGVYSRGESNKITLRIAWKDVSNASGYEVFYTKSLSLQNEEYKLLGSSNSTLLPEELQILPPQNEAIKIIVRAYRNTITGTEYGPFSEAIDVFPYKQETKEGKYTNKLRELQEIFPHGYFWSQNMSINPGDSTDILRNSVSSSQVCNHSKGVKNCNHWRGEGGGSQCMGFARVVGYYLTGHDVLKDWEIFHNWDDLAPGDYVQLNADKDHPSDHTMIVFQKTDTSITVLDCNQNGTCNIRWDKEYTKESVMNRLYYFRSYRK